MGDNEPDNSVKWLFFDEFVGGLSIFTLLLFSHQINQSYGKLVSDFGNLNTYPEFQ